MSESEVKYIPDGTGTVSIKGFEAEVDKFLISDAYSKQLEDQLADHKSQLRDLMEVVLSKSAPGTKAVYFYGGRGGLRASPPDAEKEGNRPNISEDTQRAIRNAGGLEELEQFGSSADEVLERHVQVTLTGEWATRFLAQMERLVEAGKLQPDAEGIKVEEKSKVKFSALPVLKGLVAAGSKVAKVLLDKGVKSAMLRGEELWR